MNKYDAVFNVNGKDYRFVYSPKAAWTSIRKSIPGFRWQLGHTIPDDIIKFTVLREPYSRFISQFKEVILKNSNWSIRHERYWDIVNFIRKASEPNLKVERFIDAIEQYGRFDSHLESQVNSISEPRRGRDNLTLNDIDYFFKLQNIDEDLSQLFGIDVKIERHNVGIDFDKSLFLPHKERIIKLYAEDFEFYQKFIKGEF